MKREIVAGITITILGSAATLFYEIPVLVLLPPLLLSMAGNGWYWYTNRLRLLYGIYWDKHKNPYCPVCQKPVSYGNYSFGIGRRLTNNDADSMYMCRVCQNTYPLQDALGKRIEPSQAIAELDRGMEN